MDSEWGEVGEVGDLAAIIDTFILQLPRGTEKDLHACIAAISAFNVQPYLLDKHLAAWVRRISDLVLGSTDLQGILFPCCIFHALCTVRGLKQCHTFLASSVHVLEGLLQQSPVLLGDESDWRVKYTVYAWLAIHAKLPFQLSQLVARFDLYEAALGRARAIVSSNRPEKRPAILFLANAVAMDPPKARELLGEALQGVSGLELVYRLLKCPSGGAMVISDELIDQLDKIEAKTREAAKWKCRMLPLLHKLNKVDCGVVDGLLFHKDIYVREEMSRCLAKLGFDAAIHTHILACLDGTTGKSEADLPYLHGACMYLGHMHLRNGVHCTDMVEGVVVSKCLWYDHCKGSFSVGSCVRDAACFMLWAWAKRSAKTIPRQLLVELIALALLDREVVIRRAACAAFQEAIGRQCQHLSDGLQLVNLINYYTVTRHSQCMDLFCRLYSHADLQLTLGGRLRCAMGHWDAAMRRFCADIQCRTGCIDQAYLVDVVSSPMADVYLFHGASLCLCSTGHHQEVAHKFNPRAVKANLVLEGLLLCSSNAPSLTDHAIALIHHAIAFRDKGVREVCLGAVRKLVAKESDGARQFLLSALPRADKERDTHVRTGWILVLGLLPEWLAADRLSSYAKLLRRVFMASPAGVRVSCLRSMGALVEVYRDRVRDYFDQDILLTAFSDYTIDSIEGDVGSHVRMAAIALLPLFMEHLGADKQRMLVLLLEQAVGRLDKVRHEAIAAIHALFPGHLAIAEEPFSEIAAAFIDHTLPAFVYTAGAPIESVSQQAALRAIAAHQALFAARLPELRSVPRLSPACELVQLRLCAGVGSAVGLDSGRGTAI